MWLVPHALPFIIILFILFDFINVFLSLILGQLTFIGYLGKGLTLLEFLRYKG